MDGPRINNRLVKTSALIMGFSWGLYNFQLLSSYSILGISQQIVLQYRSFWYIPAFLVHKVPGMSQHYWKIVCLFFGEEGGSLLLKQTILPPRMRNLQITARRYSHFVTGIAYYRKKTSAAKDRAFDNDMFVFQQLCRWPYFHKSSVLGDSKWPFHLSLEVTIRHWKGP